MDGEADGGSGGSGSEMEDKMLFVVVAGPPLAAEEEEEVELAVPCAGWIGTLCLAVRSVWQVLPLRYSLFFLSACLKISGVSFIFCHLLFSRRQGGVRSR